METSISKKGKILELAIALLFVFLGVSLRLLPHTPNFAPIAAISLFAGVYLSRKTALVLPLAAMIISDIFLGFYETKLMLFVYGSFLLNVILGFWVKKRKKWPTIFGSSLLGSLLFFLLTNFAVWAFTAWYPPTFAGLIQSYVMALPFFRNTLLGDIFYTVLFFGAYEAVEIWIHQKFKIRQNYDKIKIAGI